MTKHPKAKAWNPPPLDPRKFDDPYKRPHPRRLVRRTDIARLITVIDPDEPRLAIYAQDHRE